MIPAKTNFKYLVYDIESIINKPLLNRVVYAGKNLSDEEAYQHEILEMQKKDPERTFINPAFHIPVSLAVVAVAADYSIVKIGLLGKETMTPRAIVEHFWEIYNTDNPILVDFNGKGYDIRLMELWAFQLGISINSAHFAKFGARTRFAEEKHLDLQEFLTNFRAVSFKGGLNLFSKMLGKPGKMDMKGDQVQENHEAGNHFQIHDYCLGDALDTYFVFLRTRVMRGELSLNKEKELVAKAKEKIAQKVESEGYLKKYLENFGEWVPLL